MVSLECLREDSKLFSLLARDHPVRLFQAPPRGVKLSDSLFEQPPASALSNASCKSHIRCSSHRTQQIRSLNQDFDKPDGRGRKPIARG